MYTFFYLLLSAYVAEFEVNFLWREYSCVIFLIHSANLSYDWYILIGIVEIIIDTLELKSVILSIFFSVSFSWNSFFAFLWITWIFFRIPSWFIYGDFECIFCIVFVVLLRELEYTYVTYNNFLISTFLPLLDKCGHLTSI